jgi:hypothetical protein
VRAPAPPAAPPRPRAATATIPPAAPRAAAQNAEDLLEELDLEPAPEIEEPDEGPKTNPRTTLVTAKKEADDLRRRIGMPAELEVDLEELGEEADDLDINLEEHPLSGLDGFEAPAPPPPPRPPAPPPRPPAPAPRSDTHPVSVPAPQHAAAGRAITVDVEPGQTEVTVPVEISLEPGRGPVTLNLKIVLRPR